MRLPASESTHRMLPRYVHVYAEMVRGILRACMVRGCGHCHPLCAEKEVIPFMSAL